VHYQVARNLFETFDSDQDKMAWLYSRDRDMPEGPAKKPGHFDELSKFMTSHNESERRGGEQAMNRLLEWESGHDANLDPGTIIWIRDKLPDTRINGRVMVVVRLNYPGSITCLSFCSHSDLGRETLQKSHAFVVGRGQSNLHPPHSSQHTHANTTRHGLLFNLEVDLHLPKGHRFAPRRDITINCQEIWNVDCEVGIAVLGKVERASLRVLVKETKRLLCPSIDDDEDGDDDDSDVGTLPRTRRSNGNGSDVNRSTRPRTMPATDSVGRDSLDSDDSHRGTATVIVPNRGEHRPRRRDFYYVSEGPLMFPFGPLLRRNQRSSRRVL